MIQPWEEDVCRSESPEVGRGRVRFCVCEELGPSLRE